LVFSNAFPQIFTPVYNAFPGPIFQMVDEASTGHSGATGRQVSLNTRTTGGALLATTEALLIALEAADERGVVNLRGSGVRNGSPVTISYLEATNNYGVGTGTLKLTRAQLIAEAQPPLPTLFATLTAQLRSSTSEDTPQPLLAPVGANCNTGTGPTGDPALPSGSSFQLEAKHVAASDTVFLDGQPTGATITLLGPATSCTATQGRVGTDLIQISGISGSGTRLLQVKNASGLLSNEVPLP
ncbi:MAG: hypothetical protein L0206_15605, partial [Actinobacteria bacterium]|nr:hypothetical protein [Actinomycetota bacterium]